MCRLQDVGGRRGPLLRALSFTRPVHNFRAFQVFPSWSASPMNSVVKGARYPMDLLATLRTKIISVQDGDHTPGLYAVLLHIETAFKHLARGQATDEETAFTDAIYRTNQAYEGSIKEAYRVIAEKDPATQGLFDVEEYLQANNILRHRVLAQFSHYRKEWRNPSTHDYKLDFDESEALLAIISVTGFACVLFDQIAEKLSYKKSKAEADAQKADLQARLSHSAEDLAERLVGILKEFAAQPSREIAPTLQRETEVQLVGGMAGFIASAAPDLSVLRDVLYDTGARADLVVADGAKQVIIEVKRGHGRSRRAVEIGLPQVVHSLRLSGITDGILYLSGCGKLAVEEHVSHGVGRIFVLKPASRA